MSASQGWAGGGFGHTFPDRQGAALDIPLASLGGRSSGLAALPSERDVRTKRPGRLSTGSFQEPRAGHPPKSPCNPFAEVGFAQPQLSGSADCGAPTLAEHRR